jgi:hypothetical protein
MDKRLEVLDSSCIFQKQTDKNISEQETRIENYFTLSGNEDFKDSDLNPCLKKDGPSVCAKKITINSNKVIRYFIRLDQRGKIYNPLSVYEDNQQNKFVNKICKEGNKFKDVNGKIFGLYLTYLRTKNLAWLNNAEREMI